MNRAASKAIAPNNLPRIALAMLCAWTPWLLAALAVGCAYSGSDELHKPAIHRADPAHDTAPKLPPPELGLPPDPMHAATDTTEHYQVPPPPLSEDYFPCTECHDPDDEVNTKRRKLVDDHENINLEHDQQHRWCLDCHNANNRDVLHLASGATVTFAESYKLCGQCHGPKYRDWKAGVHGKRTGMWNGDKKYLLCAHCHSPHSPKFKPLAPEAPPARPGNIR